MILAIRQWWHCLWRGHRAIVDLDFSGGIYHVVETRRCECGKFFGRRVL
jgi:hypothetical protein